jgi:hypothetical protein
MFFKLDYQPRERRRIARQTILAALVVIAAVVLSLGSWRFLIWRQQARAAQFAAAQAARFANAYCVIDSTVPDTDIYFRDKLLGRTPVVLAKEDLMRLGLVSRYENAIEYDLWGEGLVFFEPSTNSYPRLTYKVPDNQAAAFLHYETPWGIRTKSYGAKGTRNRFWAGFMSRNKNGIVVDIRLPAIRSPFDKDLKVAVAVTNNGTAAFSGYHPELELHWGALDTQQGQRFHQTYSLGMQWANLAPGDSRQTILDMPLPEQSGEYSVFATLQVFRDEQAQRLISGGCMYSDSRLIRIP